MSNTEQATTTTPPAKDWREFVEERTTTGDKLLEASCFDGQWYGLAEHHETDIRYSVTSILILKPKPKTTRPWTPDEVPVGCVVKCKANGVKAVILCSDDPAGVWIAGAGWKTYRNIYDNYLLELTRPSGSTPGSYGVCGVEE